MTCTMHCHQYALKPPIRINDSEPLENDDGAVLQEDCGGET